MGKTVRPNVKGTIVEWLEHVRHIAEPRQFVRVLVMRDHRSCERPFNVDEETDLEDLAARIQACCQRSGLQKYEVRVLDEQHREIETYAVGSNKRRQRAVRCTIASLVRAGEQKLDASCRWSSRRYRR